MSLLRSYLEANAVLTSADLEVAVRHQQAQGGSLDTALLELGLLTAAELDVHLSKACGLPTAPARLLETGPERPWSLVPKALLDIGWAMPLAIEDGHVLVAVHPDLPDARLGQLYRQIRGFMPMVAPECCLAKLAAERSHGIVAPRFAMLVLDVLDALQAREAPAGTPQDTLTGLGVAPILTRSAPARPAPESLAGAPVPADSRPAPVPADSRPAPVPADSRPAPVPADSRTGPPAGDRRRSAAVPADSRPGTPTDGPPAAVPADSLAADSRRSAPVPTDSRLVTPADSRLGPPIAIDGRPGGADNRFGPPVPPDGRFSSPVLTDSLGVPAPADSASVTVVQPVAAPGAEESLTATIMRPVSDDPGSSGSFPVTSSGAFAAAGSGSFPAAHESGNFPLASSSNFPDLRSVGAQAPGSGHRNGDRGRAPQDARPPGTQPPNNPTTRFGDPNAPTGPHTPGSSDLAPRVDPARSVDAAPRPADARTARAPDLTAPSIAARAPDRTAPSIAARASDRTAPSIADRAPDRTAPSIAARADASADLTAPASPAADASRTMEAERRAPVPQDSPIDPGASRTAPVAQDPTRANRLAQRLGPARAVLAQARERDRITEALVHAAAQIAPRVALFGVKREGLRPLAVPGGLWLQTALVIPIPEGSLLDRAVLGQIRLKLLTEPRLAAAVGRPLGIPCLFEPVFAQERGVLMLYIDRDGGLFDASDHAAARELCDLAGSSLEALLRLRGLARPSNPDGDSSLLTAPHEAGPAAAPHAAAIPATLIASPRDPAVGREAAAPLAATIPASLVAAPHDDNARPREAAASRGSNPMAAAAPHGAAAVAAPREGAAAASTPVHAEPSPVREDMSIATATGLAAPRTLAPRDPAADAPSAAPIAAPDPHTDADARTALDAPEQLTGADDPDGEAAPGVALEASPGEDLDVASDEDLDASSDEDTDAALDDAAQDAPDPVRSSAGARPTSTRTAPQRPARKARRQVIALVNPIRRPAVDPTLPVPEDSLHPDPRAPVPEDSLHPDPGAPVPEDSLHPDPGAPVPEDSLHPDPGAPVPEDSLQARTAHPADLPSPADDRLIDPAPDEDAEPPPDPGTSADAPAAAPDPSASSSGLHLPNLVAPPGARRAHGKKGDRARPTASEPALVIPADLRRPGAPAAPPISRPSPTLSIPTSLIAPTPLPGAKRRGSKGDHNPVPPRADEITLNMPRLVRAESGPRPAASGAAPAAESATPSADDLSSPSGLDLRPDPADLSPPPGLDPADLSLSPGLDPRPVAPASTNDRAHPSAPDAGRSAPATTDERGDTGAREPSREPPAAPADAAPDARDDRTPPTAANATGDAASHATTDLSSGTASDEPPRAADPPRDLASAGPASADDSPRAAATGRPAGTDPAPASVARDLSSRTSGLDDLSSGTAGSDALAPPRDAPAPHLSAGTATTFPPAPSPADASDPDAAIDRYLRDPDAPDALAALRRLGREGLLRLAERFPGPIDLGSHTDVRSFPPPSAHGPLLRACVALGDVITPYILDLIDHPRPQIRFYAAFLFQELRDPRCLRPLALHAFDPDADVRLIATRVLESYSRSSGFVEATEAVRGELRSRERERALLAAEAAGTLRDTLAVPTLIDLLSVRDKQLRETALEALCSITAKHHGYRPAKWRAWFDEHGEETRIEWVIDALRHRDAAVRRWAADELVRVSGHRPPPPPDGEKQTPRALLHAWLRWWDANADEWR